MKKLFCSVVLILILVSVFVSCNADVNRKLFECEVTLISINNPEDVKHLTVKYGDLFPIDSYQITNMYYDKNRKQDFDPYSDRITSDITLYWETSGCIAKGTLIRMADGTQKAVENISVGDEILSYNFYDGVIEPKKVLVLESKQNIQKKILTVKTQSGKSIEIMDFQSFYDADKKIEFWIDNTNYIKMAGRKILIKENNSLAVDTIISVTARVEVTDYYDLASENNFNFFGNDILSLLSGYTFVVPFEIGDDFKVNQQKMAEDIARYGLLTYEEYPLPISKELFDGLQMKYHKIIVAKGYVTWKIIAEGFGLGAEMLEGWD